MQIQNMTIEHYLRLLKTREPAPGGGAVCGLSASQGVALLLMVLDLSIGKKTYMEWEEENLIAQEKLSEIFEKLLLKAEEDRSVFLELSKAYSLPNITDEDREKKENVLSDCSIDAASVPMSVLILINDAVRVGKTLIGKTSKLAISDIGVAAQELISAARSAWLNIKINAAYIREANIAQKFLVDGMQLVKSIENVANEMYVDVEGRI
ncbi:MAG: cyclodeaminase/cyclohydrolase family protein [Eubacteriales bacterium]|nr:cyclodeaminase/cyclohydrolase family protein [Eubacteriales bacterium]MDY3332437.1 cyclodeaminase/cyclohydrolase family protein [Gallibacter sp.]